MRGLPPSLRKWIRRFHEAGEAGLLSHSRRPVRSPNRRVFEKEQRLILSLRAERKLGARRIQSELRRHHDLKLSLDSIHKVLAGHQPSSSVGALGAAEDATPVCSAHSRGPRAARHLQDCSGMLSVHGG